MRFLLPAPAGSLQRGRPDRRPSAGGWGALADSRLPRRPQAPSLVQTEGTMAFAEALLACPWGWIALGMVLLGRHLPFGIAYKEHQP